MGRGFQSVSLWLLFAGATGLQRQEPESSEDLLLNMFEQPVAKQTLLHTDQPRPVAPVVSTQVAAAKASSSSPFVGAGVSAAIANMMSGSSMAATSAAGTSNALARAPAPSQGANAPGPSKAAAIPMVQASGSPAPALPAGNDETDQQSQLIARWFTWKFWHVMVYCAGSILVWSEVVNPLVHMFAKRSFMSDSLIFFLSMISFLFVAAYFADPKAAGSKHALTLSTIMTVVSFLNVLFAVSLKIQKKKGNESVQLVADDVAGVFVPLTRVIAVFLIVQGVLDESGADWNNLVLFGSFIALGLAFALGGLVKDIISYFFIRMKNIFKEGDFIYYHGQLFQVRSVTWMFTEAYAMTTRSIMFIPNGDLALAGVMNQSRDDSRIYECDLPLPAGLPPASLEAIVTDAWALLRGLESSGFTALSGEAFDSQVDVKHSGIYLSNIQTGASVKEFAVVNLHLRLFGQYYYSHPPPWPKEETKEEPPPKDRQRDWFMNWHYQIEWVVLQMHKIIASHSA